MNSAIKKSFFGDYVFEVCENVYEPAEDSFLFAENLRVKPGSRVLDMGTGSGILGTLAAKEANEVVAVDVNPFAVHCAKHNAALNNVQGKMSFIQGDLFAPLDEAEKFDLILFNSPYLPMEEGEVDSWLSQAWAGGVTGRQVIDRFISQAPSHLAGTGRILLLQSTLSDVEKTVQKFAKLNMTSKVLSELALPFFEKIVLIEVKNDI
jgi:release factor glutamine methyltransferase